MHASIILLVTIVPLIESHDVAIGLNNYGKKIFAENRQASPAIWRQKENVTIEAAENEVITKVIIIDMRPEKDGDASIVDGGEGKKNVTIELKSPTVLRGYDFHIEVFSAPEISENGASNDVSSSVSPTPDCIHQTSTNAGAIRKETSTDILNKSSEEDKIRPVRTTNEEDRGSNIEGSTLHTSVSTSYVTSTPSNANDEATTLANDTTTKSNETTTIVPDINSNNGNYLSAVRSMESNETNPEGTVDEFMTTTLSDSTTEVTTEPATVEFTNGKDVLDFPDLIGMNDDDTRHAREAKHEATSTISDVTTEVTTEQITTLAPENSTNSEIPDFPALSGQDGNDTRRPRKVGEDEVTSTMSHFTDGTTELITILSPESENNKAILDLAAINDLQTDETTENGEEEVTSTEVTTTEIATEVSTTFNPNNYENSKIPMWPVNTGIEDDTRRSREATDGVSFSDMSKSEGVSTNSTETEEYSGDGQDDTDNSGLSDVFGGKEDDITTKSTDGPNNSQLDFSKTIPKALFGQESDSINPLNSTGVFNNPLNIFGNTQDKNDTVISHDSSATAMMNSQQPQVLRNSRDAVSFSDIFGNNFVTDPSVTSPNYPLFVNPPILSEGIESNNNDEDYVYLPLIAIVSKSSYPSFQEALQSLIKQSKVAVQTPN